MNENLIKELINEIKVQNKLLVRLIAQREINSIDCKQHQTVLKSTMIKVLKSVVEDTREDV